MERLCWTAERAAHIRTRSERYPGAIDIDPAWTQEAGDDQERVVDEPDPKSARANSVRIIGYSPSARMVVTVVGLRVGGTVYGASAWKASGADLRRYWEGRSDG